MAMSGNYAENEAFTPTPGTHYDEGKPRYDLSPPEAEDALARILGYGADKYEARNWEKGIAWTSLYASTRRHLAQWMKGNDIDPESGHPHLEHALCNIAFLVTYARREQHECDDRPLHLSSGNIVDKMTLLGAVVDAPTKRDLTDIVKEQIEAVDHDA